MAIHSSVLAWRIPWAKEPGRLRSTGLQRVEVTEATSMHVYQFIMIDFSDYLINANLFPGGFNSVDKDCIYFAFPSTPYALPNA